MFLLKIFKLLPQVKTIQLKPFHFFSTPADKAKPENFPENLSELESFTKFNYDENVKKLSEISKIVFPNINQFSLKRQKQIFYTYAPYQMMDSLAYKTIEKNLMKSFNEMEFIEVIKFIKCLSHAKYLTISPSVFLLIEHKIMKNLISMTPEQFLSFLESYDRLNLKKNNRIYKILLNYFSNKFQTMPLLSGLKAIVFLIRSKQCNIKLIIEVLEGIFNKIRVGLDSLNLNQLVLIYFLFFSEFLKKNLVDWQSLDNHYKFQIKENINQILLTGQSSIINKNEMVASFLLSPKQNYENFQKEFEEKLNKIMVSEKKIMKLNDIFVLFDSFFFLERKLPKGLEESIIEYINENAFNFTPNEIFKMIEIASEKKMQSEKNLANCFFKTIYSYLDKFLKEFSAVELCHIWKYVDFYNLGKKFFIYFISIYIFFPFF